MHKKSHLKLKHHMRHQMKSKHHSRHRSTHRSRSMETPRYPDTDDDALTNPALDSFIAPYDWK